MILARVTIQYTPGVSWDIPALVVRVLKENGPGEKLPARG